MDVKTIISEIESCNSLAPEDVDWLLSNYTPIASKRKCSFETNYYDYENVYMLNGRYFIVSFTLWESINSGDIGIDDNAFAEEVKPVTRDGGVDYVPK